MEMKTSRQYFPLRPPAGTYLALHPLLASPQLCSQLPKLHGGGQTHEHSPPNQASKYMISTDYLSPPRINFPPSNDTITITLPHQETPSRQSNGNPEYHKPAVLTGSLGSLGVRNEHLALQHDRPCYQYDAAVSKIMEPQPANGPDSDSVSVVVAAATCHIHCCLSLAVQFGSPGTNTYCSPLCMAPIQHPYRRAPHLRQTNSLVPECSVRGVGNANPSQTTDSTECITPERCIGLTAAFSSSQI
ncbi:hypothetical protein CSAL01_11732 [Colletotrichum salicis]|uniref:Uncharacterized protein n=1 Tax=Colletotrichum salicis TaxID=1209931 RepID=A0A135THR3_9PEZI|nr:hypothetical protein CSAL01_11732 [Colletotrichum salicis]